MGTVAEKLTYLNTTKGKIKDVINISGANITNQTTFRNYAQKLYDGYINMLKNPNLLIENMPKATSSGSISNGLGLPAYETKLSKLSSQPTTTGANLQKFSQRTNATYNYVCDNKGQVTIGQVPSYVALGYNLRATNMTLTPGTYTIKVVGHLSSLTNIILNGNRTITLDENQEFLYELDTTIEQFYIALGLQVGLHDDDFYITLAEGTTATLERYTGGAPSPSASYPQPITNVSNNVDLTITDSDNSRDETIQLNGNEIAGLPNTKDELVVDKTGHCYINKKIGKIASYNGETITTEYMSTTGGLNTGATIYYELSTPQTIDLNQTIDLTLAEGSNTITNSEDMNMEIKYIKETYE